MTKRDKIIKLYKGGLALRETAAEVGVSMQRVHFVIKEYAPHLMRPPHVNARHSRASQLPQQDRQ
jgi:transposase-like protein